MKEPTDYLSEALTSPEVDSISEGEVLSEDYQARQMAERLGLEYVDLDNFEIDPELFRHIPVDLMFRYNFVPRARLENGGLSVVVADPTDVLMLDELEMLLGSTIDLCVGTAQAIQEILKKSESSQRVLDEATEDFRIQIVTEDEETGEDTFRRQDDFGLFADHQADRLHDIQRSATTDLGYSCRNLRERSCHQVSN